MTSPVTRRRVLYIPGFDPFPARRYRELYRTEGAKQADLSGYDLTVGRGAGAEGWTVTARIDGQAVETQFEVLTWSDIVRDSMDRSIFATYLQLARTAWVYLSSGALFRLARLRQGPVIAALYPVGVLLLQLCVALGVGAAVVAAGARLIPTLPPVVFWPPAALVVWSLLRWFKSLDRKVFAHYLMHDYAFTAQDGGAYPPALDARVAAFADRIAAACDSPAEEVLIVGHSSGAHLAISALADLKRAGRVEAGRCALLTLGHVVPMVSFLPKANRLRSDLHLMSEQADISWVDVTAPGDGCAFALCDPAGVTGVAPADQTGPLILSAAFTKTLRPDTLRALRHRYFRLHFQYLCAFDNLQGETGAYDYFRITAGPMRLADRFAERRPSPSVKRAPVNRYRDMADGSRP